MKRTKEILFLIIFLVGILLLNNIAYASSNVLKVVEQSSETKYLENDQGYIWKTIVDSNEKTGEVTVEVKMANNSKESVTSNDTEIILVIDNFLSMDFKTPTGETRKKLY